MKSSNPEINYNAPKIQEFVELRRLVGWGSTDPELARASLSASLFHVTLYENNELIAMGRVVGDGHMYFYIQDVIVHPAAQGRGLGAQLMNEIESYLDKVVRKGATVGLLAAKGKEEFYGQYGYLERSGEPLGMGMCKFI